MILHKLHKFQPNDLVMLQDHVVHLGHKLGTKVFLFVQHDDDSLCIVRLIGGPYDGTIRKVHHSLLNNIE